MVPMSDGEKAMPRTTDPLSKEEPECHSQRGANVSVLSLQFYSKIRKVLNPGGGGTTTKDVEKYEVASDLQTKIKTTFRNEKKPNKNKNSESRY